MDAGSRGPGLPLARAPRLLAKTLYRQLTQGGYGRADVVAFVNELLSEVSAPRPIGPMDAVDDVETALPNTDAIVEVLDFELKRARNVHDRVALLCIDIELPDLCDDDTAARVHARIARQLRRGVRPSDTVGRLGPRRYAIVLPRADRDVGDSVAMRLLGPVVHSRRVEDGPPAGTRVSVRCAADDGDDVGSELLARCLELSPRPMDSIRRAPSQAPAAAPRPSWLDGGMVLALGGGAARAAAHIGVLRVLRREKVDIRGIAATSAGALVGAMSLLGISEDDMLARFVEFTRSTTYRQMRRAYAAYRRRSKVPRSTTVYFRQSGLAFLSEHELAAFDDDLFEAFIEFFVGPDRDIASLSAPFAIATTDLVTARSIHMTHGPLHKALRASCALPGLFLPQRDGDRVLIDGSMIAEVPVRAAARLGDKVPGAQVLAVHLARPEREVATFATSSEVVLRSGAVVHKELVREQLRRADQLLTVHVEDIGWLDFRRALDTAAIGEVAAAAHLERALRISCRPPPQEDVLAERRGSE